MSRLSMKLVRVLIVLALCMFSEAAEAQLGVVSIGGSARTPLVLDSTQLRIDCTDGKFKYSLACTLHASYYMRNPSDAQQNVLAGWYGSGYGLDVRLNGVSQIGGTVRGDGAELSRRLKEVGAELAAARQGTLFNITLEAGQSATLVVTTKLPTRDGFRLRSHGWTHSASLTRHLLLGSDRLTRWPRTLRFGLPIGSLRTFASMGPVEAELGYPAMWDLLGGLTHGDADWELSSPNGLRRRARLSGVVGEQSTLVATFRHVPHTPFRLSHVDGPVPIYHGGPLVGVGARAGAPAEFRMRFGYEFAAPDWLIHGLAVDTDFEERVVLTPMIDAASPSVLFILPSVGLGLGVPIRIVPEATVGMRFQGTLQWPIVGFVTSIDVYPGSHVAAHDRVEATLLGRVSL